MAKTIKFNLICNNTSIRNIEELKENFCVEDVLSYYDNKILHRWLDVRGYHIELEMVKGITSKNPVDVIKELIKIFDIETDNDKVEEATYIYEYVNFNERINSINKTKNYRVDRLIKKNYYIYDKLINKLICNSKNIPLIKATVSELIKNYYWIIHREYRSFFFRLYYDCPVALFFLVANVKFRKEFFPRLIKDENGEYHSEIEILEKNNAKFDDYFSNDVYRALKLSDIEEMYMSLCFIIDYSKVFMSDILIEYKETTNECWKELEPKGKKFMILKMGRGNCIRNAGEESQCLEFDDINKKFVIVDGIEYKGKNNEELYYIEV